MKLEYRLTADQPRLMIGLSAWSAKALYIDNPTPFPVFFRRGSQEVPTRLNRDHLIHAGSKEVLPVVGREFGFALSVPTNVPSSHQYDPVIIIAFDENEVVPNMAAQAYIGRAQENFSLLSGQSFPLVIETIEAPYLSIDVLHNGISTNPLFLHVGSVKIEQSYDGINYSPYKLLNMWDIGTFRKTPHIIIPTPQAFVKITVQANATMVGAISYSLLNNANLLPSQPSSFNIFTHSDASDGIWQVQNLTLVDRDMSGRIVKLLAWLIHDAANFPAFAKTFTVEITPDNDQIRRYVIGDLGSTTSFGNRNKIPQPQSFTFTGGGTTVMYLYEIDTNIIFSHHLKITFNTLESVPFGKFTFLCEEQI